MSAPHVRRPAKKKAARKEIDPRQIGPIAYVVDSSGTPVTHRWRPTRNGRYRTTKIGIYWQETGLPDNERGIHTVWLSDEQHGDTYPWKLGDPRPVFLTRFMREASSGLLSATFKLTEWGRECAAKQCKCKTGGALQEARRTDSKRAERGGMSSKEWKQHLRKLQTQTRSTTK